jgi:hypothetical protein
LLALAVAWLFGLGHECIRLSTTPGTRADRFYKAQGWTRIAGDSTGHGGEVGYVLEKVRREPAS